MEKVRVLVVGDVMLDRYWFGEVTRISPEAPVPIVRIERQEERLGGAANVASNVVALGAQATGLLGVIGKDEAGSKIKKLLKKFRINNYLNCNSSISTIVKLRIIGRQQQLLRTDFENTLDKNVFYNNLICFNELINLYDIVILSDYAKGSLFNITDIINAAIQHGKLVLIDPKGNNFIQYKGANVLTPNCSELINIVGLWRSEKELTIKAQQLRESLLLEAILLKRSEKGVSLYIKDGVFHFPAVAREVYDVSGAGDTVIAVLAIMLGKGATLADAAKVANKAGGIVVGKFGTATISIQELFNSELF